METYSSNEIPEKWRALLCLLPDYDPIATAEDCVFCPELAINAISFFPDYLSFTKGEKARQPFYLEKWQASIIANMMGWLRPDGTRRYRECFILIPRKNGKTEIVAGLGLMFTFADGEDGAENYCGASEKGQATLLWDSARVMLERQPQLVNKSKVYTALKSIVYPAMESSLKPISSEVASKHGYNVHFFALDELHTQKTNDLLDVMETATASRVQPMIINLTTSDYDGESLCNDKQDYAEKVCKGVIKDNTFLPVLYQASRDDDWTDPKVWAKANPNLGISVREDYIHKQCEKAKLSPNFLNTFKRLHLNIKTSSDVAWLLPDKWEACGEVEHTELEEELKGEDCYMGIDLASVSDLTGVSLYFPATDTILSYPFVPESTIKNSGSKNSELYIRWEARGSMTVTSGNVTDYEVLADKIYNLHEDYNILGIGIDPFNASHLSNQLNSNGCAEIKFVRQGFLSLSAPTKEIERLVLKGEIRHGNHPVMNWCVGNVMLEMDSAENIKPSKRKSKEKIDLVASLVCAKALEMEMRGENKRSVYEDRAPLMF